MPSAILQGLSMQCLMVVLVSSLILFQNMLEMTATYLSPRQACASFSCERSVRCMLLLESIN